MIIVALAMVGLMIGVHVWHHRAITRIWVHYLEATIPILESMHDRDYIASRALENLMQFHNRAKRNKKLKVALDDYLARACARLDYLKTTPPIEYDD